MERNGFNPSNFETSGDKSDESKEKTKSKKKKSPETPKPEAEIAKKESFADRFKASLGEKLIEEKPEKSVATEKDKKAAEHDSAQVEHTTETSEDSDTFSEGDGEIAEISAEENAEIDERLVAANIELLNDEIAATDDEAEIVASQAAIDMLEDLGVGELEIPADEVEAEDTRQQAPDHEDVSFADEDEPLPFDDEADIPLTTKSAQPKSVGAASSAGAGSTPPPPPPSSPNSSSAMPPVPAAGMPRFNMAPTPNVVTSQSTEYQPDYQENPNRTYLLVGGVVGYLIGRRRGRIKTERRMNKVVKKLETQVEAKQRIIDGQIEATKRKARSEYWASKDTRSFEKPTPTVASSTRSERMADPKPELKSAINRAERTPVSSTERLTRQPGRAEQAPSSVELKDTDIRRLSETITIGATNLRKIHEARLITDGGLRRLVNEHLQGKDIRRGLAREFLTKELSYERDPRFRDIVPLQTKGAQSQPITPVDAENEAEPVALATTAMSDTRAPQSTSASPKKVKRSNVSTGVLSVLSLVALALALYAVWLGMSR